MSANKESHERPKTAIELKARTFTFPLLRLLEADMDAVETELAERAKQMPQLFRGAPVVIDLGSLAGEDATVEFPILVGLLRGYGIVPVGVWRGSAAQNEAARAMDLAIVSRGLGEYRSAPRRQSSSVERVATVKDKIVRGPVRSGQRVYEPGGDLVLFSHVGPGAEVMADGSIHVYGALRGRAVAGVNENRAACIFCQEFCAELVSIAGHFRTVDDLDPELLGKPAYVWLDERGVRVEPMSANHALEVTTE